MDHTHIPEDKAVVHPPLQEFVPGYLRLRGRIELTFHPETPKIVVLRVAATPAATSRLILYSTRTPPARPAVQHRVSAASVGSRDSQAAALGFVAEDAAGGRVVEKHQIVWPLLELGGRPVVALIFAQLGSVLFAQRWW